MSNENIVLSCGIAAHKKKELEKNSSKVVYTGNLAEYLALEYNTKPIILLIPLEVQIIII